MSYYVPNELYNEILLRLPAKTLVAFTLVCKAWYDLITSSAFISQHCKLSICRNTSPLLLRMFSKDDLKEHYTLYLDDDNEELVQVDEIEYPFKTPSKFYYRIVGSTNGLYSLSDDFSDTDTMILWNPAVKKYVKVPKCGLGPDQYCLGLGFDSVNEDYKIVKMAHKEEQHELRLILPPDVEIYSLSTHSWRRFSGSVPMYRVVETVWTQAFLMGAVHWIGFSWTESTRFDSVVLCFDMSSETFRTMNLPEIVAAVSPIRTSIADYRGSLSLIEYNVPFRSTRINVWVMQDYGVVGSWTKSFTVDLGNKVERVLGFRKNGQLFLEGLKEDDDPSIATRHGYLYLYDPSNQSTKLPRILGFKGSFYVDPYVDSVVLLDKKYAAVTYNDGQIQGNPRHENQLENLNSTDVLEERDHPLSNPDAIWVAYKALSRFALLKYAQE